MKSLLQLEDRVDSETITVLDKIKTQFVKPEREADLFEWTN